MRSALNSPSDKIQPIRLMRCQPAKEPLFSLLKTVVLADCRKTMPQCKVIEQQGSARGQRPHS